MSHTAWRLIELEQQQREQLRLTQVRARAVSLLRTCEVQMGAIQAAAVQQLAVAGLKRVRQELNQATARIDVSPDKALKEVRSAQRLLHKVIADAEAKAGDWSRKQAETKARIDEIRTRLAAEHNAMGLGDTSFMAAADRNLDKADRLYRDGQYSQVISACEETESLLTQASKSAFDETVRREAVRSLLATLTRQGFIVDGPILDHSRNEGGSVVLTGRLPSGKTARFEIQLDGHMSYDLDGYEGRACAAQIEGIEKTLQEQFGVKLGPPQVTWKDNPDRISKGARNRPSGTTYHGTR